MSGNRPRKRTRSRSPEPVLVNHRPSVDVCKLLRELRFQTNSLISWLPAELVQEVLLSSSRLLRGTF
jgi:hypothetical protein